MASPNNIPALTSIRGIAAVWVVFYHIYVTYPIEQLAIFIHGELAVDLFFILSGYIMALVYEKQAVQPFRKFYMSFMFTRAARIYPLHIATLLFLVAIVAIFPQFASTYPPHYFTIETFISNLLLVQTWGFTHVGWNMVSWSISAEWFMYLLFPVMLYSMTLFNKKWLLFSAPFVIILLHHITLNVLNLSGFGGIGQGGLVRVLFEFTLGFSLFYIRLSLSQLFNRMALFTTPLLLCGLFLSLYFYRYLWFLFVPFIGLLIVYLSTIQSTLSKVLSARILVYLGNTSFSLYMWHWIVINIQNYMRKMDYFTVETTTEIMIATAIIVTVSMFIAHCSFHYLENPSRAFFRQLRRI